jgi:hypothetical protein
MKKVGILKQETDANRLPRPIRKLACVLPYNHSLDFIPDDSRPDQGAKKLPIQSPSATGSEEHDIRGFASRLFTVLRVEGKRGRLLFAQNFSDSHQSRCRAEVNVRCPEVRGRLIDREMFPRCIPKGGNIVDFWLVDGFWIDV